VPRGFVDEAMPEWPDELAGELGGVADHLLRWDGWRGGGEHLFDFALGHPGLFQSDEQEREQVMGQGGEMGLSASGGQAVGPGFLLVEFVFEHVEELFDFPAQSCGREVRSVPDGGCSDRQANSGPVALFTQALLQFTAQYREHAIRQNCHPAKLICKSADRPSKGVSWGLP